MRRYCISCITRARSSCCYTGICCIGYLAWIQRRDIDRSTRGAIRELVFPNWANYIYMCVYIYMYTGHGDWCIFSPSSFIVVSGKIESLVRQKCVAKIENQNCLYEIRGNLIQLQREDWRRGLDFFFFFSESRDSLPLISCTISSKRTRENFYCPAKILYFIQIINKITLDRRDDDEIIIILRRTWRHASHAISPRLSIVAVSNTRLEITLLSIALSDGKFQKIDLYNRSITKLLLSFFS